MEPEKVGDFFFKKTKYIRGKLPRGSLNWKIKPEMYKSYPDAPIFRLKKIYSEEKDSDSRSLHEILTQRKSIRMFKSIPIDIHYLSYLLWASTGITRDGGSYQFRSAPSAGALYPIETYLCINQPVTDFHPEYETPVIPSGIYHYNIFQHALEQVKEGDFSTNIAHAALDQQMAALAPIVFIWTAIFQRSKWKYKQRAYRYIFLDAGHIAAHLSLAATDLGLGSCQIAAIYDNELNRILDIDGKNESGIYLSVVGHPKTNS